MPDAKPATKPAAQPKRRYEQLKDYRLLPRHQMEFGREISAANYWKDKLAPEKEPRRGR
jgi:hypothetical protein